MEEKIPERLYACFCRRKQDNIDVSVKACSGNHALSQEADALRNEHLRYAYGLGERGITWMAGPLGKFQGTLSIYSVNSMEEAREAKRNDPYYKSGVFYDDRYYEWFIHAPLTLLSPAHRDMVLEGLKRAGLADLIGKSFPVAKPGKQFACFSKMRPISKGSGEIVKEHFRYQFGYLWKEGITMGGGPVDNYEGTLQILAVDSLEEARKMVENDPFNIHGIFYDNEIYEWFIHMPFPKASPSHKDHLRRSLIRIGITP